MDTITFTGTFAKKSVSLSPQTIADVMREATNAGVPKDQVESFLSKLQKSAFQHIARLQCGHGKIVFTLKAENGELSITSLTLHTN